MSDLLRVKAQKQPCSENQKPLEKKTQVKHWSTQGSETSVSWCLHLCGTEQECNLSHTYTKPQEEGIELCHPTGYKPGGEKLQ